MDGPQVIVPRTQNLEQMFEASRRLEGLVIAVKRSRGYTRRVAVKRLQIALGNDLQSRLHVHDINAAEGGRQQARQDFSVARPRIDGRDQNQTANTFQLIGAGRQRGQNDGEAASARGADDVGVLDAHMLHESQNPFRVAGEGAVGAGGTIRKTAARQVDGIYREISGQRLQVESPGKRVAEKTVNQQQWRAGSGKPVTPIDAIDENVALFSSWNQSELWHGSGLLRLGHARYGQPGDSPPTSNSGDIASVAWGAKSSPFFSLS